MRYFLFVLLFILSTQSFADIKGKGLFCIGNAKAKAEHIYVIGYIFPKKGNIANYVTLSKDNYTDKFKIKEAISYIVFTFESDFILIGNNHKLNRKTLDLLKVGKYTNLVVAKCVIYKSKRSLMKEMKSLKKKLQKKYDRENEGNKI